MAVWSVRIRRCSRMPTQLLACSGKSITVENCHPTLTGMPGMGHIGLVDHGAIWVAFCLQTFHTATIQAQPDRLVGGLALDQGLYEDLAQALYVNAAILQRFIDAGKAPLEEDRERQFGQTACLRFAGQGIAQIEECIPTALKAVIDPACERRSMCYSASE
jgi:hypothetical protein